MLRFRWKHLLIPAVLVGVLALAPNDTLGQRPGGWGGGEQGGRGGWGGGERGGMGGGFSRGGMGGGMSADNVWNMMGGSGKDTIDLNQNPQLRQMMQSRGQAIPADGILRKDTWKAGFEQQMAARMGGGSGMVGAPSAAPAAPTTSVKVIGADGPTGGQPMTASVTPGGPGMGGPPGGGFGGPPGGGWGGGGGMSGDDLDRRFREYDKDQNGKISREEASQSRRLGPMFDQYDTNKDGTLDLTEYKSGAMAMMGSRGGDPNQQGGGWGGGSGGDWNRGGWGGGSGGGEPKREEVEEERAAVFRFGKLPTNLPKYFTDSDFDSDGQIGLYEWVKAGFNSEEKLTEFKSLDLNGDGLITAEEYLRANKLTAVMAPAPGSPGSGGRDGASPSMSPGNGSMSPGGGGGGPGGSRGGFDPDQFFKQLDKDGDGKVSREEAASNPMARGLVGSFDQTDTNKDGGISPDEYKAYIAARFGGGGGGGDRSRGGPPSGGGDGGRNGYGNGGSPQYNTSDKGERKEMKREEKREERSNGGEKSGGGDRFRGPGGGGGPPGGSGGGGGNPFNNRR